jgi:23S rRNA pseudouridine2605 synthase
MIGNAMPVRHSPVSPSVAVVPCLARHLAMSGVASRRRAAEWVKAGRVTVDGVVERDPGRRVAAGARVTVDGGAIGAGVRVSVMLNKPSGWTCTVADPHAIRTVIELVPMPGVRLYPAGRLDQDSEGLLILTSDGDFAQRLTHPRHGVRKTYEVTTRRPLSAEDRERLLAGVEDEGERLRAEAVLPVGECLVRLLLAEGRKREIRRMVRAVGNRVERLRRIAVGALPLGDLAEGKWREMTPAEMALSLRPGPPKGWFPPPRPAGKAVPAASPTAAVPLGGVRKPSAGIRKRGPGRPLTRR